MYLPCLRRLDVSSHNPNQIDTISGYVVQEPRTAFVPTEEEVKEHGRSLGIDVDKEPELLWIAEEGLTAPLPEHWAQVVEGEKTYYFNFHTGDSIWDNPLDDDFRRNVAHYRVERQFSLPFTDKTERFRPEEIKIIQRMRAQAPSRSIQKALKAATNQYNESGAPDAESVLDLPPILDSLTDPHVASLKDPIAFVIKPGAYIVLPREKVLAASRLVSMMMADAVDGRDVPTIVCDLANPVSERGWVLALGFMNSISPAYLKAVEDEPLFPFDTKLRQLLVAMIKKNEETILLVDNNQSSDTVCPSDRLGGEHKPLVDVCGELLEIAAYLNVVSLKHCVRSTIYDIVNPFWDKAASTPEHLERVDAELCRMKEERARAGEMQQDSAEAAQTLVANS